MQIKGVTTETSGIEMLQKQKDNLTTVMKSGTFGGIKPQKGNHNNGGSAMKKGLSKSALGSPYKGNGPATSSAGPFKSGSKPLQCYKCGGWGHTAKNWPSLGGIKWRSLQGVGLPLDKAKGPEENQTQKLQ